MTLDEIHGRVVEHGKPGRLFHLRGNDIARVVAGQRQNHRALLAGLQGDGRIRRFRPVAAGTGVGERADAHRRDLRRRRERGGHHQRAGGRNAEVDVRRIRQGHEDARLAAGCRLLRLGSDLLWRRRRRLDDDGNDFPDGRNFINGDGSLPRAEDADDQKQEANRIHPGELAFRFAAGRGQAQPRQFVFQLVAG